jgi:hypothetical protein
MGYELDAVAGQPTGCQNWGVLPLGAHSGQLLTGSQLARASRLRTQPSRKCALANDHSARRISIFPDCGLNGVRESDDDVEGSALDQFGEASGDEPSGVGSYFHIHQPPLVRVEVGEILQRNLPL